MTVFPKDGLGLMDVNAARLRIRRAIYLVVLVLPPFFVALACSPSTAIKTDNAEEMWVDDRPPTTSPTPEVSPTPWGLIVTPTVSEPVIVSQPVIEPCGTITLTQGIVTDATAASASGSCFVQAFQHCVDRARMRVINYLPEETTNTSTFTITLTDESCVIDVFETGGITLLQPPGTPIASKGIPPTEYYCASVIMDASGTLHFTECSFQSSSPKVPFPDVYVPTLP